MNALIGNLKSKTSWLGTGLVVFGTLYDQWPTVAQLIPQEYLGKSYAAVGVLVLVLRNLTNKSIAEKATTPILPPSNTQGGFARVSMLAVIALLSALMLAGCKSIEERPATAKLVTQYAVLKFAEQSSADKRAVRIEHVRRIAADVKAIAAGEPVSLALLKGAAFSEISKLQLSPADTLLAHALVDLIAEEIALRVGDGVLSPDQLVQVAQVMDWVVEATTLASPPVS